MMSAAPLPPGGGPHRGADSRGARPSPDPAPRERLSWLWWAALVLMLALAATAAILLDRAATSQDGLAPPLVDVPAAPRSTP